MIGFGGKLRVLVGIVGTVSCLHCLQEGRSTLEMAYCDRGYLEERVLAA